MELLRKNFKISEVFFILAGLGMAFSALFLPDYGFNAWLVPKIAYVAGVLFYIFKR